MKQIIVYILFILAGVQNSWALRDTVNAEKFIKDATMAKANEAYQQECYKDAIDLYSSIYKTERVSAALYYNLGNSYYRTGNIAKAIVNYERAYLLDPSDADIKFNLDLARSKTVDKITPQSEMFFVTWTKALILSTSVKGWATTAIVSFSLALLLVLVFIFYGNQLFRKIAFFSGIFFFVLFVVANIFAYVQQDNLIKRRSAIVIVPATSLKGAPSDNSADVQSIHAGTKVYIDDPSMIEWKEVHLEDGKKGWVRISTIEII